MPAFRVIIPTKNRQATITRAVASALAQRDVRHEVVVVDDGGSDATETLLAPLLRADQRLSYLRQPSSGVSAARNRGASEVDEDTWLAFLDSDDEALTTWLSTFAEAITSSKDGAGESDLAIVFAGAEARARGAVEFLVPHDLGPTFNHIEGLFLAGTFAIRAGCFRELGGYTAGLAYSENTDLGMRFADLARSRRWHTVAIDRPGVVIHWTGFRHSPEIRLAAAEAMLRAHATRLARDPDTAASYRSIAGVASARLGRYREARGWFLEALKVQPRSARNILRAAMSLSPVLLRWRYPSASEPHVARR